MDVGSSSTILRALVGSHAGQSSSEELDPKLGDRPLAWFVLSIVAVRAGGG